mgnify:CR=1 FL=1
MSRGLGDVYKRQDRNRIMAGKLKGIESMDAAEADAYLGIAEQTDGSED